MDGKSYLKKFKGYKYLEEEKSNDEIQDHEHLPPPEGAPPANGVAWRSTRRVVEAAWSLWVVLPPTRRGPVRGIAGGLLAACVAAQSRRNTRRFYTTRLTHRRNEHPTTHPTMHDEAQLTMTDSTRVPRRHTLESIATEMRHWPCDHATIEAGESNLGIRFNYEK